MDWTDARTVDRLAVDHILVVDADSKSGLRDGNTIVDSSPQELE